MDRLRLELATGHHQRQVLRGRGGQFVCGYSKVLVLEGVSYLAEPTGLGFGYLVVGYLEEILTEPVQSAKEPVAGLVKFSPNRRLIVGSPQRSECDLPFGNAKFHIGVYEETDFVEKRIRNPVCCLDLFDRQTERWPRFSSKEGHVSIRKVWQLRFQSFIQQPTRRYIFLLHLVEKALELIWRIDRHYVGTQSYRIVRGCAVRAKVIKWIQI